MVPPRAHNLALLLIVAAVTATILALAVAAQKQHQHTIEAEQARLATAAQVVDQHMQGTITIIDNLLRKVADDLQHARVAHARVEGAETKRILTEAARLLPGVGVFYLVDARGDLVASSLDTPVPDVNVADRQYFKELAAGHEGLHIGRAIDSRLLPAAYFTVSRALRDAQGHFHGALVAGVDIRFAKTFYDSLNLGDRGIVGVYRKDGANILRHPFDRRMLNINVPADVAGTFQAHRLGVVYHVSPIDGVERLVAYREVAGLPLYVVVGKTSAAILAKWRRGVEETAVVGLMFLAVVAGLAVTMLRGFHREEAAQAELARSNERIGLALRLVPVTLAELDADLRYTWIMNPYTGGPPERFIGQTLTELFGHVAPELDGARRDVLRSGQPRHLEAPINLADGARQHVDAMIEPRLNARGEIIGIRSAITDITERTEEKLALVEAKAEADRANQAKSRFLAAASHDLRQPLHALRLFLDLLSAQLADTPQQCAVERAREAMTSVERLLAALLDMSRLEAGLVQPEVTAVRVDELLAPVIQDCETQAAEKGLRLRLRPCGRAVLTDPVLFQRILRNLVVNAIRYTRQGGVLVGCRCRGRTARVEVWDTGAGIPPERLTMIFEEFYRMPEESSQDGGLGLGLSIVERTARLLGHRVEVRSRPGHGTVFTIILPLAEDLVPSPA